METVEIWRPVVGQDGAYQVSNLGRIRSLDRIVPIVSSKMNPAGSSRLVRGRILRPGCASNGYLTVSIGGISVLVQHIVAEAFLGRRPEGHLVLHGDGIPTHNQAGNLRYGTRLENADDMVRHGTRMRGTRYPSAKLCEFTASVIAALKGHWSQSDLAMLFDVSPAAIQAVHDGRTWQHTAPTSKRVALGWFFTFGPAGRHSLSDSEMEITL